MSNNIPRLRARHLSRRLEVSDAFDLDTNEAHIIIRVILRHPHELADVLLRRIPVHHFRDMRVSAPDADRKFIVFDVAD
jgi:hypothetical protein